MSPAAYRTLVYLGPVPCSREPELFDLLLTHGPTGESGDDTTRRATRAQIRRACALCWECPARVTCGQMADRMRPSERAHKILAARLYDGRGQERVLG